MAGVFDDPTFLSALSSMLLPDAAAASALPLLHHGKPGQQAGRANAPYPRPSNVSHWRAGQAAASRIDGRG